MALSPEELEALVRDHQDAIYRYLLKRTFHAETAEDLKQDVLLRIHRSQNSFDPTKGEFGAWAMRIAQNVLITHAQKGKRNPVGRSIDADFDEPADPQPGTAYQAEQKLLATEIKNAIRRLPEPERTVVYNKEIKKIKLAQTAEELGLSIRTVSRKLLSAYDILRAELTERGITPETFGED